MFEHSKTAGVDDWLTSLVTLAGNRTEHSSAGFDCVLVTIVGTRGSAPREAGTKMLVMQKDCVGTIGGGHLESKVISRSRELLSEHVVCDQLPQNHHLQQYALGASLGQCCGGHVEILFERLSERDLWWVNVVARLRDEGGQALLISDLSDAACTKLIVTETECIGTLGNMLRDGAATVAARSILSASIGGSVSTRSHDNLWFDPIAVVQFNLCVFGAGHVGQAVVNVLQSLPCNIRWIDSREEMFSKDYPPNVVPIVCDEPEYEIDSAAENSYVLVMTHNHQLDLKIVENALSRSDIAWCGLIGSVTKRRRFLQRLKARGFTDATLDRLKCPIGIDGISGKHPAQIAIAVAAELLQAVERESTQAALNISMSVVAL